MVSIMIDLPILQQISSFSRLTCRRVTAWILLFVHNCHANKTQQAVHKGTLKTNKLISAEERWIACSQQMAYPEELTILRAGKELCNKQLQPLRPFIDERGVLHVGSRIGLSQQLYERCHQLIIPGKHLLTKLIIRSEHLRLLDAGSTPVAASLACRFHIRGVRRIIRSITRECVVCCRAASKPGLQLLSQLPPDWLNPGPVFH